MEKNENTTTKNGTISAIDYNTKSGSISDGVKKDRPQNKNLVSLADRTREERQAIGRKGGLKSGEKRKARKSMKETILDMISQEIDPKKLEKMGVDLDTLNGDYTIQGAIISAMIREAINGDTKAMSLLRDTMGEQPVNKQEIRQEVITQDDLKTIDNLKQYLTG